MYLPDQTLLQGGKYKIIRFIASGGFGCTYEAEHIMLEKRVAIKEFFIKDFCNRDETTSHVTVGTLSKKGIVTKLLHKFINEARNLAKLQHPGIVHVSDVFEENGTAYYVMDYIEGKSLKQIINEQGPLSEEQTLKYIREVADALAYVHAHNLLHLDIKPGNIMINSENHAILIDFGASKQYDEENGENTSTLMGKTLGYAPLEQMSNDVVQFMPATDIYALGATLYKMLTGVTPLSANLLACDEEMEPLPETISKSTRKAIEAAMKLSKKRRTQSIADFLAFWDNKSIDSEIQNIKTKESIDIESKGNTTITNQNEYLKTTPIQIDKKLLSSSHKNEEPIEQTLIGNFTQCQSFSTQECVDLGLSIKWRNRNLGADKISDSGKLYTWADLAEVHRKNSEVDWTEINENIAGSCLDCVTNQLGVSWKMPTRSQWKELIDKCHWMWISVNGVNGYQVTGRNGNSIFLPAAGKQNGKIHHYYNEKGYYWTSTKSRAYETADFLLIDENDYDLYYEPYFIMRSIRPVCE